MLFRDLLDLLLQTDHYDFYETVINSLHELPESDCEPCFLLALLLDEDKEFLKNYLEAIRQGNSEKIVSLTLLAESFGVPITLPIYIFECFADTSSSSFHNYFSVLSSTFLDDARKKYGKTFGIGTKTANIDMTGNYVFFETTLFIKNQAGINELQTPVLEKSKNIYVGPGVGHIPNLFFANCPNLVSLFLANSVSSIGEWALENCSNLKAILGGDKLSSIGERAFAHCGRLRFVPLPFLCLNYLGSEAFESCASLEELSFGEYLKRIEFSVFANMQNLRKVTFLSPIEAVGVGAFYNCKALESISAKFDVQFLPAKCFAKDISLYSFDFLPLSFMSPASAFEGTSYCLKPDQLLKDIVLEGDCSGYWLKQNIKIDESLTVIVKGFVPKLSDILEFYNIKKIKYVGTNSIPQNCFENCKSLLEIEIESPVLNIGKKAFINCLNLSKIFCHFEPGLNVGESSFENCGSLDVTDILKASVYVGRYAFANNQILKKAVFNPFVKHVEPCCLSNCLNVTLIDTCSFAESSLAALFKTKGNEYHVPSSLKTVIYRGTEIDERAFSFATSIKNIYLPNIVEIKQFAFSSFESKPIIEFGPSLLKIDPLCFFQSSIFERVSFPNNAGKYISDKFGIYEKGEKSDDLSLVYFYGLPSDAAWALNNVSNIKAYAFQNRSFGFLTIPKNIRKIESKAFYKCSFENLRVYSLENSKSAWRDCYVEKLNVLGDSLPKGIFGYSKDITSKHFKEICISNLNFQNVTDLFSQNMERKLSIAVDKLNFGNLFYDGISFIENKEKNISICVSDICADSVRVCSGFLPDGKYGEIIVDEKCPLVKGLLKDVSKISSLVVLKKGTPLSIFELLADPSPKINSLTVYSSIAEQGLSSLSIGNLCFASGLEKSDSFNWGEKTIEAVYLPSTNGLKRTDLFKIQQTITKNVFVDGKTIPSDDYQVENDILYAFIGLKKKELSIENNICHMVSSNAFIGIKTLNKLSIGPGVSLQINAFPDLVYLEELTIDGGCNFPIKMLFSSEACRSLKKVKVIGEKARATFCDGLKCVSCIDCDSKAIGSFAFANCPNLQSIELSSDLTSIDDFAFYNCKSLKQIVMADKVKYIGFAIFSGCCSLEKITIPSFVGHRLSTLKEGIHVFGSLFGNLIPEEIEKYNQVSQITKLGTKTFYIPSSLEIINVLVNNGIITYGFFSNVCVPINMTGELNYASESAFENAKNIYDFDFSTLKSVGTRAFYNAHVIFKSSPAILNLCNLEKLCDRGLAFDSGSFDLISINAGNCSLWCADSLATIFGETEKSIVRFTCSTFPKVNNMKLSKVKEVSGSFIESIVPPSYFYGMEELRSVSIENEIREIHENAFGDLSLDSLKLSFSEDASIFDNALSGLDINKLGLSLENVSYFGMGALSHCKLKSIDFLSKAKIIKPKSFYGSTVNERSEELILPENLVIGKDSLHFEKVDIGKLVVPSSEFNYRFAGLNSRGISIDCLSVNACKGKETFDGFNGDYLELQNVPSSIPFNYFSSLKNLRHLALVNSKIKRLNKGSFNGMDAIERIDASFEKKAFIFDGSLPKNRVFWAGDLPEFIETDISRIDECFCNVAQKTENLFLSCSIVSGPFNLLQKLKYVEMSGANVQITKSAFADSCVESVRVLNNLIKIDDSAFRNAHCLKGIAFDKNCKFSIGDYAFYGDSAFKITNDFLNRATSIGHMAFLCCSISGDARIPLLSLDVEDAFHFKCSNDRWFVANQEMVDKALKGDINNLLMVGPFDNDFTISKLSSLHSLIIDGKDGVIPSGFCKNIKTLSNVEIKEGVTSIGKEAFYGCSSLEKVSLPKSVTFIGLNAFCGCSKHIIIELEDEKMLNLITNKNRNAFCISRFLFITRLLKKQQFTFRIKGDNYV